MKELSKENLSKVNVEWVYDIIDDYMYKYGIKPKEILVGMDIFFKIIKELQEGGLICLDGVEIADVSIRFIGGFLPNQYLVTHNEPSMNYLESKGKLK